MSNNEPEQGVGEREYSKVLAHLQSDEQIEQESTLQSVESLQLWMMSQPALRQMFVVEKFSDIGPAILKFLRIMLGFDREPDEDSGDDLPGKGGQ